MLFSIEGPDRLGLALPPANQQERCERSDSVPDLDSFEAFVAEVEPRLHRALVAALGVERGRDAAAEAMAFAWEHRGQLEHIDNVPGYLYRVGRSRSRKRKERVVFVRQSDHEAWHEPALPKALASLTERQRVAVVLVHSFDWSLREVADLTGVKVTTVQNHLERGLGKLRSALTGPSARLPDLTDHLLWPAVSNGRWATPTTRSTPWGLTRPSCC